MTRATKPTWRMVSTGRGDMAVAITEAGILIRRKGRRTTYGPIGYGPVEDLGAKLHAALATRPRKRSRTRNLLVGAR